MSGTDWEALAEQLYDALLALNGAHVRDTVDAEVAAAIAAFEAAVRAEVAAYEGCDITPPESGSEVQQDDGSESNA